MSCLTAFFLFYSHAQERKLDQIRSTEIVIPFDEMLRLEPKRTILRDVVSIPEKYRFVVYFDSLHCSSCEMKGLPVWNGTIDKTMEADVNMDFTFIFTPKMEEIESFKPSFITSHLLVPVYLDTAGVMLRDNELLNKHSSLRCFVVDSNNKIVFVGDPSRDEKTEQRYSEFLQGTR